MVELFRGTMDQYFEDCREQNAREREHMAEYKKELIADGRDSRGRFPGKAHYMEEEKRATMSEYRIHDVVIYSIERMRNSTNGNPRFKLNTSEGTLPMQVDAALGYSIENYTNSRYPETFVIGNPDNPAVTLLTTKGRQVYGIEYNGKVLH